jgi:prepilin-type N-terminal cleavage/methylation domain-containing protein
MDEGKVTGRGSAREQRGFSLLEVLITVAILGLLALLAAPFAGKIIRRSQTLAGYSSMRQALAAARLQAVKRGVNVVVLFSVTPENKIQMHTFQDRANTEAALTLAQDAAASNFEQDTFGPPTDPTNEPTLGEIILPSNVVVWKQGGTKYDTGAGIAFDEYTPPGSLTSDPSLTDRVAFLPSGGIAPPEDTATSGLPNSAGGRGIYVADSAGKNFFRVTVDSDVSGRLRVEKYQADAPVGYRVSGWTWY